MPDNIGNLRREIHTQCQRQSLATSYFALRYLISTPFHSGTLPKLR